MIKKEINLSVQPNVGNGGSLGEVWGLKKKCFCLVLFFGCYLLSASFVFSLDPHKHVTQYMHRSWSLRQGLPQSVVHAIARTSDGYLWLGTQEGLARFDGVRFEIFDRQNVPQLKNNWIRVLCQDRAGRLWIGTYGGGLTCLNEGRFTTYTTADGLSGNTIRAIHEDRGGNLWIGTNDSGLFRLKDGKFFHCTSKQGLHHDRVFAILEDRAGNLWVGTGGGLNRLKNGKFTNYTTKQGLAHDEVYGLYEDRSGSLWVGTRGGLNRLKDGVFATYTTAQGLSHNEVRCIVGDRDGNLWIGTYAGGLNRFFNDAFTAFTGKQGLGANGVWSLYEDPEGGLWVGTEGGGLSRLRDGLFTPYTTTIPPGGLSNNMVRSIYEDRSGSLWFGTSGGGLNRLKDGSFTTYTRKNGLTDDDVWSLYEEPGGSLWIGTNGGLNRLKDGVFTTFTTEQGLCHNFIRCILRARGGSLWIGTSDGLNRLKDGVFTAYTTKQGLYHNGIRCLHEDGEGTLWIGTAGGLNRLKGDVLIKERLSHSAIRCFHEDAGGSLWIGTSGGGLKRFKKGAFTAVTTADGLFDDKVHTILEDKLGNLWMSSNKGVFRVAKKEVEDFFKGKRKGITCFAYDERHGMKSRECNGGSQPAGCRTPDGSLWFPTIEGAVKIEPVNLRTNTVKPPLVIEALVADKEEYYKYVGAGGGKPEKDDKLTLPKGTKRIEIRYTALSFTAPDAVRFKYLLEGYDTQWSDPVAKRSVVYTNLHPGNYTFRVKGCNSDGLWNEKPAALSFYLTPFFYQTIWFKALSVLFLVFFLAFLYRFRVRHLRDRERKLQLFAAKRTRELATIVGIVREINRETSIEKLLQTVLDKSMLLFPHAERSALLIYNSQEGVFKVAVQKGHRPGVPKGFALTYDQAVDRYLLGNRALDEGANIIRKDRDDPEGKLDAIFPLPQAMLAAAVVVDGKIRAMLVLANDTNPNAFNQADIRLLARLREHAASAIGKILTMEELEDRVNQRTAQLEAAKETAEKAKEKAEAADRAKSEFLTNMSHEIRTPMNAILGFSEILEHEIADPQHKEYLEAVSSSGKALLALINDILDLSKIEAGKLQLQTEPVNVRSILNDIKNIFSGKIKDKALEYRQEIEPALPEALLLDGLRIRQVLFNLVGNAAKFTHHGYVKVSVNRYTCDKNSEHYKKRQAEGLCKRLEDCVLLCFEVSDTGIGIPADQQKLVFEAFSQQEGQRNEIYGGSGLGLAITNRLTRIMGGSISLRSEVGKGSTFTITLPCVPIAGLLVDENSQFEPENVEVRFHECTILLVDDSKLNRHLIKEYLAGQPIRFIEASNGKKAIREAKEHTPHLIIMDLVMPGMDGIQATTEIKKDEELKKIPIIMVTASIAREQELRAQKAGVEVCLKKPLSRTDFIAYLKRYLSYSEVSPAAPEPAADFQVSDAGAVLTEAPLTQAGSPTQLNPEDLHQLLELMKGKISHHWQKTSKRFVLTEIEELAEEVRQLGDRYGVAILTEWGKRLLKEKQRFQMTQVERTMALFPRLISDLEETAKKD